MDAERFLLVSSNSSRPMPEPDGLTPAFDEQVGQKVSLPV
jgi:hypothetical protein